MKDVEKLEQIRLENLPNKDEELIEAKDIDPHKAYKQQFYGIGMERYCLVKEAINNICDIEGEDNKHMFFTLPHGDRIYLDFQLENKISFVKEVDYRTKNNKYESLQLRMPDFDPTKPLNSNVALINIDEDVEAIEEYVVELISADKHRSKEDVIIDKLTTLIRLKI